MPPLDNFEITCEFHEGDIVAAKKGAHRYNFTTALWIGQVLGVKERTIDCETILDTDGHVAYDPQRGGCKFDGLSKKYFEVI